MSTICQGFRGPGVVLVLFVAGIPVPAAPPDGTNAPEGTAVEVRWSGELKNVMRKGDATGTIELQPLTRLPHLYAVGALEGLQGEVTILDGSVSIARIRDGKVAVEDAARGKACVLVYAQVPDWIEVPLPRTVQSLDQLEEFLVDAANKEGINVKRPFPFRVAGKVAEVRYHVLRHPGEVKEPHELHEKAQVKLVLKDSTADLIGFYSDQHLGVFTCGGNLHVHVRSVEAKVSGHLDEVKLGDGVRLLLPKGRR